MIGTEVRYLFISLQNLLGQNQEVFKLSFSKAFKSSRLPLTVRSCRAYSLLIFLENLHSLHGFFFFLLYSFFVLEVL